MSLYATPAALNADCYKSGHIKQYPDNTQFLMFNLTARSDKYFNTPLEKDGIIVFGIRRFCKDYLVDHWNETFFRRNKKEVINEIMAVMNGVLGEGSISRKHWEDLHDLGYLPIIVDAVPEGTLLPVKVPMLSFMPTMKEFAWVAGYLEDAFSNELWKVTTIATIAFHYRRICEQWAAKTCDNNAHVPWQCHDFSLRGLSGMNDGAFNSIGHLTSFKGTDDFSAVYTAGRIYGEDMEYSEIGNSVPATEHSVMTANIQLRVKEYQKDKVLKDADEDTLRGISELDTFKHLLTNVYPTGIVSIVSDSYNYWRTIGSIANCLKSLITERDGKLVFRPDSGNPLHVICGYKAIHFNDAKKLILERMEKNLEYHGTLNVEGVRLIQERDAHTLPHLDDWIMGAGYDMIVWNNELTGCNTLYLPTKEQRFMCYAELIGTLRTLWDIFGGDVNSKGYKTLDSHVGVIYGDSITMELADKILERMAEMGFASSNIVFGLGSYTYQYITRDTFGFAVKATYLETDSEKVLLCKEPVTDMGLKKSAKGCVAPAWGPDGKLFAADGMNRAEYDEMVNSGHTLYECVFYESEVYGKENLAEIRKRIDSHL